MRVQIIDFSDIYSDSGKKREALARKVNEAAINIGIFYITGICDNTSINNTYEISKQFHNMDLNYKKKYLIGQNNRHAGYVPFDEKGLYEDEDKNRRYESYDISLEKTSSIIGKNLLNGAFTWPDAPDFKKTAYNYFLSMLNLSIEITSIIEIALNLEPGILNEKMTHPASQLRLLHYIKNNDYISSNDMNMGAHTDYECFTILHQTASGLQSQTRNGKWINVSPIENTYVFNIGDTLECLTNGLWKSNVHRVINTQDERYSLPFFSSLNFNEELTPLASFQATHNNYLPIKSVGQHLTEQITRDFTYLRRQYKQGLLQLKNGIPLKNMYQYTVDKDVNKDGL